MTSIRSRYICIGLMIRRVLCWLLLTAMAATAAAQADTWLEIRTPAFTIVTNSTEKDGRRVARQAEGRKRAGDAPSASAAAPSDKK